MIDVGSLAYLLLGLYDLKVISIDTKAIHVILVVIKIIRLFKVTSYKVFTIV